MNKKGFVFLETIITVVVLTTTLVLLYASYSGSISAERKRLYYDDISYVYRSILLREILDETIDQVKFDANLTASLKNKYVYAFGINSNVYYDNELITAAYDRFKFYTLMYINLEDIDKVKSCIKDKRDSALCRNYDNNATCDKTSYSNAEKEDCKCCNTVSIIDGYGESYLVDYLLTIDVPTNKDAAIALGKNESALSADEKLISDQTKGILIALYYETKNGSEQVASYTNCLYQKIYKHYNVYGKDDFYTDSAYMDRYNSIPSSVVSDKNKIYEYGVEYDAFINYMNSGGENISAAMKSAEEKAIKKYYKDSSVNFDMHCENAYYIAWVYK